MKGFQLDYLAKVPEVKDTVHKQSLLYHLCCMVMEKFPNSSDFYSDLGALHRCSRVMWWTQTQALERTWSISHMTCDEEQHSTGRWKMPVKFLLVLFLKWQHWKGFFYPIALFICYFWSYFFQWEEIVLFVLSCSVQLYLFGFPLSKDLFQNNE